MTLVLQSNKAATKNIGNVFGVKSTNDYSLVLDFEREYYAQRGSDGNLKQMQLADFLSFNRSGSAWAYNQYGELAEYAANTPRIATIFGKKGLVLEGYRENLFLHSATAVTQTVVLPKSVYFYAVTVIGNGAVRASGSNITLVSTNDTATDGTPVIVKLTNTAADGSLVCAVTGQLSHVQVERLDVNYTALSSPIVTTNTITRRFTESAKISDSVLLAALGNSRTYTIVAHAKLNTINKDLITASNNSSIFCVKFDDGALLDNVNNIQQRVNKINKTILGAASTLMQNTIDIYDKSTTALSVTDTIFALGSNGFAKNTAEDFSKNRNAQELSLSGTSAFQPFHVLQKLIIYPRALTGEEVAKLSGSWV